jgi:hypothetical protein
MVLVVLVYVPAAQAVHDIEPGAAAYEPIAQGSHALVAVLANVPAVHNVHESRAGVDTVPGLQARQEAEPVEGAYRPFWHVWH